MNIEKLRNSIAQSETDEVLKTLYNNKNINKKKFIDAITSLKSQYSQYKKDKILGTIDDKIELNILHSRILELLTLISDERAKNGVQLPTSELEISNNSSNQINNKKSTIKQNKDEERRKRIEEKFSLHDKELMSVFALRSGKYVGSENIYKRYKVFLILSICMIGASIFSLLKTFGLDMLSVLMIGISGLITSIMGIQRPPFEDKGKNDEWIESKGKKILIARLITMSCIVFSYLLSFFNSDLSKTDNGKQIILGFLFAIFFYGLFTLTNLYVIKNPEKLLSPKITGLGTGFYIMSVISLVVGFVYMRAILIGLVATFLPIGVIYLYLTSPTGVNPIQTATLGVINPKTLFDTFEYYYNAKEYKEADKKREQKLKETYGDVYYRVHTEQLIEQQLPKNKTIKYIGFTILAGLFSLIIFIVSAATGGIIEYIAQTIFTDDVNTFFCNKLGLKKFCK